jgi:hypothetical protein
MMVPNLMLEELVPVPHSIKPHPMVSNTSKYIATTSDYAAKSFTLNSMQLPKASNYSPI